MERLIVAPAHTGDAAVADGVAGTGVTVIVMGAEVAGLPVTPLIEEVIVQVITSPFASVELLNVTPVPEFTVFTFH